jgi:hypothetical protein
MMEICLDTVKSDFNSVSASVESFIVKRLVDISKELTDSFSYYIRSRLITTYVDDEL